MSIDMFASSARHASRGAAIATGLVLGGLVAPAFAEAPASWEEPASRSALHFLLLLVGFPAALALVIFLFTYLPSMMRGKSTEPALVFQERNEWFGGPRKGTAAADSEAGDAEESDTGGAGARW